MKHRLVMVEDDPLFGEVIKRFYEEIPKLFQSDGELIVLQTLGMLKHVLATGVVELVILDLTLPDSTQAETVEMIFQDAHKMPPIMAITGDERIELRDKCLMAGVAAFALKKHCIESPNYFFANCYDARVKGLHAAG